jgi:hypothetical protein
VANSRRRVKKQGERSLFVELFIPLLDFTLQRFSRVVYVKRPDTVGQPSSAEIGVSNMPSWKAKKLRKLPPRKGTPRTLKGVGQQ